MVIDRFHDKWWFLSNFYPCVIYINGQRWSSSEHLFQAHKTLDLDEREKVRLCEWPSEAKRLGRQIVLREDWSKVKDGIMMNIVMQKFIQNLNLNRALVETDNAKLIEGNNWHDNYWGDCICDKCKDIDGSNMLGKILMTIRDILIV